MPHAASLSVGVVQPSCMRLSVRLAKYDYRYQPTLHVAFKRFKCVSMHASSVNESMTEKNADARTYTNYSFTIIRLRPKP